MDHMEAPDVNALRLILVLQQEDEMGWNGFMWLGLWVRCSSFENTNKLSHSVQCGEILVYLKNCWLFNKDCVFKMRK